ncbi:hypothetical protein UAY_00827 [Enterococcus moraviensis ATCC BAA-383]|uniref:Prepilin-type N-terminal cleavage/methylation domain-containing protein n=1 Tax=Enterococcus moraviensis ATCC BAA-383 TaxID=1158609 RepID=R2R2J0_9ENTE|nr:hypothetical protein UAY_00827 [Enterococcus moraviensis ATCC BAA-383]EOT74043.1 hypothetical protein I586_01039 [Enterococcus moraviensis ATCC BAA-383]
MIKRSFNYKGYILLESLIALSIVCLIVLGYMSSNTFLLKKNKQAIEELALYRMLYEETKHYENHGGELRRTIKKRDKEYQLYFYKGDDELREVEIMDGKDKIKIKKE